MPEREIRVGQRFVYTSGIDWKGRELTIKGIGSYSVTVLWDPWTDDPQWESTYSKYRFLKKRGAEFKPCNWLGVPLKK